MGDFGAELKSELDLTQSTFWLIYFLSTIDSRLYT